LDKRNPISNEPCPRGKVRFLESIPDFLALLGEETTVPIAPTVIASTHRWLQRWANRTLQGLAGAEIKGYLYELSQEEHSGLEVERERRLLRCFFRWARRSGWVSADPTLELKRSPTSREELLRAWSALEQRRLLEACRSPKDHGSLAFAKESGASPPYLYPLVLLGLRTGIHLENLIDLEWRQVDLLRARARLPSPKGSPRIPDVPLDVPLDKEVRAELGRILRKAKKLPSVPYRVFDAVALPLFKGAPDKHEVIRAFKRARQKAGIFPGDFQSLRLSFARNCACAAVPISFAARPFDQEEDLSLVREIYEEHLILETPPKK